MIKFITIFLARYDANTRTLVYTNAGHNPPLLIRPTNGSGAIRLNPTGAAIGLTESFTFRESSIRLEPGDYLLLYTDGATEAGEPGVREFGETRLEEWMAGHAALAPKALIDELWGTLRNFTRSNALRDDLTLIAAKVT